MKTISSSFLKLALAVLLFSNAALIFYIFQYQKQQNSRLAKIHEKLDVMIKNNSEFQSEKEVCLQVFLENDETQELESVKIDYIEEILIDSVEDIEFVDYTQPPRDEEPPTCGFPNGIPTREATPKEGINSFYKYINENLNYPKKAIRQEIEGKVIVNFIIDKNGEITDVKAQNDIGGGCAEEAERIIKSFPKWNPARQRGRAVKTKMSIPIVFDLVF